MKNKIKGAVVPTRHSAMEKLHNDKHFASVVAVFPEAFVSGKFCDVKIVCMDTSLWAHRIILSSVSPFLQKLLVHYEKQGDDVVTLLLPMIKGYHMKLVLDYIYSGAMYLCGAHMQYVIQVMEVLQLKCGVSVNKIVGQSSGQPIEVEHSTVTIKTDAEQEADSKPHLNGGVKGEHLSDQETKGSYKLRRKSASETPSEFSKAKVSIVKTKSVKRKFNQSDAENNELESESEQNSNGVIKNNCQDDSSKQVLEISPISGNSPPVKEDSKLADGINGKEHRVEHSKDFQSDDEDECNDVVMVELDEEFVVEKIDKKDASIGLPKSLDKTGADPDNTEIVATKKSAPSHRCALCGRSFKHYMNLQVHLTGHLGVKVNIHRCSVCRKNFRNKTELDLHVRSHKAAKLLGKMRNGVNGAQSTVLAPNSNLKAKVITTTGARDKKIIRKYMKNQDRNGIKSPKIAKKISSKVEINKSKLSSASPSSAKKTENLTCGLCDKSFGVKSLFLRHVKKSHPELSATLENHSQLKTLPSINIKKCLLPKASPNKVPSTPSSPRKVIQIDSTPPSPSPSGLLSPKKKVSSPGTPKPKKKKERSKSSSSSSLAPDLPDYYNTLECPDCEKQFVAKSIFERHLQSARHGVYGQVNSSQDSDSTMSPRTPGPAPGPATPHWTQSPLTAPAEGGAESPAPLKIECHLCGQTFVRVKDLAKHREKMCQAYHA